MAAEIEVIGWSQGLPEVEATGLGDGLEMKAGAVWKRKGSEIESRLKPEGLSTG